MRASLTAADEALAIRCLAGESPAAAQSLHQRVREEGADVLWDDARLLPALLACTALSHPSAALFVYVALRRTLLEVGVDRRDLADYGAALVIAFGRGDRAWRTSERDENQYAYVTDLIEQTARSEGERQFQVLAHLGNFALWLTGLFPDHIAAKASRKGGPGIGYYEAAGRTGFQRAAEHRLAGSYGLADVLGEAGERFTQMRVALNHLSDRMLFPHVHTPERLMRQVQDEFRLLH